MTKIFNKLFLAVIGVLALTSQNVYAAATQKKIQEEFDRNPIVKDLNLIVNFLSAGVGIIVVAVIIIGGIQYSMAGDNPQAVTAAKQRIFNGLIALATFILMAAFLQWLVPGGVFNTP